MDTLSNLENFCSDPIWEPSLTWNTNEPKLTQCLGQVGFPIAPNVIFLLLVPLEFIQIFRSQNRTISINAYNSLRFLLCALSVLVNGYQMINEFRSIVITNDLIYNLSDFVGVICKLLSSFILFVIFIFHRSRGRITSGIVWICLFLNTICSAILVIDIYSFNEARYQPTDVYVIILNFLFNALLLILCSFTDDAYEAGIRKREIDQKAESIRDDQLDKDHFDNTAYKQSPESYQSFLSSIFFSWFTNVIWSGRHGGLNTENMFDLEEDIKIDKILRDFGQTYDKEVENFRQSNKEKHKKPWFSAWRLLKVIVKQYGLYFLGGSLVKLVHDMFQFMNPILLEILIGYVKDRNRIQWHGLVIVFLVLFVGIMRSILINLYFERMMKIGMKMKSNIINLVYKKSLRLSSIAKKDRTTGEIVNLISVDASRFNDVLTFINLVWSAPLQIIVCIYLLYQQLGVSVFAGLCCIIAVIPINGYLINLQKKIQFKQMKYKDERIKFTNEILSGIKILKLYCWEPKFMERVCSVRATETSFIKKNYFLNLCSVFFFSSTTMIVSVATFSVYVFSSKDNLLTPEKVFVSIALFGILQFPINLLPMLANFLILAAVAMRRINTFLNADELVDYVTREFDVTVEGKAVFSWEPAELNEDEKEKNSKINKKKDAKKNGSDIKQNGESNGLKHETENHEKKEAFSLKDIELKIKKGSFCCIIGQVGSGKSSVLSSLLGEMLLREDKMSGECKINISKEQIISYGPQLAWIQNDTLRDNILFGNEFDKEKYEQVIHACELEPDLAMLPGKDLVEIGEKGINLSGGQKQRVSLARVCYASTQRDADPTKQLIFLDDPLSAVDAHVGKSLIENVLSSRTGILKDTTRILVTNQLPVLKSGFVDQILVMKDGRIEYDLTFDEMINMEKSGELARLGITLKKTGSSSDGEDEENETNQDTKKEQETPKKPPGENVLADRKLIDTEKLDTEKVSLNDYHIYIKNAGYLIFICCVLLFISEHSVTLVANVFLSDWTNTKFNATELEDKDTIYEFNKTKLTGYALICLLQLVANVAGNLFLIIAAINTSLRFHKQLLYGVLRSSMVFFDTTPLGRIINRFSRDVDVIDSSIPSTSRTFISCMFRVIAALFIICYMVPKIFIGLIGVLVVFYYIQKLYVVTSRQIKRLESITRSPIYSHFSETLTGTSTIRAYNATSRFINQSNSKINLNNKCYWLSIIGYRWLGLRLDAIGNIITLLTTAFVVFDKDLEPGTVGLIVSYAMNCVMLLTWSVRMISELETNVVSVERINEYSNNKPEDEWIKEYKPPVEWPEKGVIDFHNYSTRYREGTNLVLKDLTVKIDSTEKVGIVGRTGAGKSTITLALFRIIEPVQGQIIIDNIDVTKIGLHSLRSRITIIPQDPVLFSGTIRFNLDPFDKYTDEQIWQSLESAHLKDYVSSLEEGLQYKIAEGGENLSIGQRQLICLTRALLKKSKILVLDEATASVDYATDDLIQQTIRKEFVDCTTITIAHRINTILDSTKILVLDKGKKVEYDSPESLLNNVNSLFYSLATSANEI